GSVVSRRASASKYAAAPAKSPPYSVSSPARRTSPEGVVCWSINTIAANIPMLPIPTSSSARCSDGQRGRQTRDPRRHSAGEIAQRDTGGGLGFAHDNRLPAIGQLGHPGLQRDLAEQRPVQLGGEAGSAARQKH